VARETRDVRERMADKLVSLQLRCFHMRVCFSSYWRALDEVMMRGVEEQMEQASAEIEQEEDLDELAKWEALLSLLEKAVEALESLYSQRTEETEEREEEEEMESLTESIASM